MNNENEDIIKANLWSQMTLQQLMQQKEIFINRMAALMSLIEQNPMPPPSMIQLYNTLQAGYNTLLEMIKQKH